MIGAMVGATFGEVIEMRGDNMEGRWSRMSCARFVWRERGGMEYRGIRGGGRRRKDGSAGTVVRLVWAVYLQVGDTVVFDKT